MPLLTIHNQCDGVVSYDYEIFSIDGFEGYFEGCDELEMDEDIYTIRVRDLAGCEFQQWDDGRTERYVYVDLYEDTTITAITSGKVVNKVVIGDNTIIDLTGDTLSQSSQLATGVIAHKADGHTITGTGTMVDGNQSVQPADVINTATYTDTNGTLQYGTATPIVGGDYTITDKNQMWTVDGPAHLSNGNVVVQIADEEKNKIIPSNIKTGVTILGQTGTLQSSEHSTLYNASFFDRWVSTYTTSLYIVDNYVTAANLQTLFYILQQGFYTSPRSWCKDFQLIYNNVASVQQGVRDQTFNSWNTTGSIKIELPLCMSVSLPIIGANDQTRLINQGNPLIITYGDTVTFNATGTTAVEGCILLADENNTYWMTHKGLTNGLVITDANGDSVTLPIDHTHMTLGDYEWWDSNSVGTIFAAHRIS